MGRVRAGSGVRLMVAEGVAEGRDVGVRLSCGAEQAARSNPMNSKSGNCQNVFQRI